MEEVFSELYKRKVFAEMFSDKVADIVQTLRNLPDRCRSSHSIKSGKLFDLQLVIREVQKSITTNT